MKTRLKNILIFLTLSLPAVINVACEKDLAYQDNDLIDGKWKDTEILNNDTLNAEDYMAYTQYAHYHHLESMRVVTYVTFIIDSTLDDPIVRFEKYGVYSINGDTLSVRDWQDKRYTYFIQYIRNDSLCYKDAKGKEYIYVKFKE